MKNLTLLNYVFIVALFGIGVFELYKNNDLYDGVAMMLASVSLLILNINRPQ